MDSATIHRRQACEQSGRSGRRGGRSSRGPARHVGELCKARCTECALRETSAAEFRPAEREARNRRSRRAVISQDRFADRGHIPALESRTRRFHYTIGRGHGHFPTSRVTCGASHAWSALCTEIVGLWRPNPSPTMALSGGKRSTRSDARSTPSTPPFCGATGSSRPARSIFPRQRSPGIGSRRSPRITGLSRASPAGATRGPPARGLARAARRA